jgi:hypothetical protein
MKFFRKGEDHSSAILLSPLFGTGKKYSPILLTFSSTTEHRDWFDNLNDTVNELYQHIVSASEDAKILPYVKGGKMAQVKLQNHADSPLVTVLVVTHSGDCHLLGRALDSLCEQDMRLSEIEILIYFDGAPSDKDQKSLEPVLTDPRLSSFYNCQIIYGEEKNGYYCVGRNRITPLAQGFYISNMDADNEFAPNHLSGLAQAMRVPQEKGFPHFAYTRRKYIVDPGVEGAPTPDDLVSPLTPWVTETISHMMETPNNNFIDTGDFMVSKAALYRLADNTGCIWNSQCRRFADWDLICRFALSGFRGQPVDQITNLYHWTGVNVQMTSGKDDLVCMDSDVYAKMVEDGLIKED